MTPLKTLQVLFYFFMFFIIRLRPKLKHLLNLVMWCPQARYNAQGSPCQVVSKCCPVLLNFPVFKTVGQINLCPLQKPMVSIATAAGNGLRQGPSPNSTCHTCPCRGFKKIPGGSLLFPQLCSVDWGVYNREIIEEFKGIFTLWLKLTSSHNALPPWASGAHSDLC